MLMFLHIFFQAFQRGSNLELKMHIDFGLHLCLQPLAHPKLKKLGRPHKTSEPEHITDTESEFVVTYLKHAYPGKVVFEVCFVALRLLWHMGC